MNFKDHGFYIYEMHYPVYQNGISVKHKLISMIGATLGTQLKACNRFPTLQGTFLLPLCAIYVFLGVGIYFSENIHSLLAFLLIEITLFRYCVLGT